MAVCSGACRIRHLVRVGIPAPHCVGVLENSFFRWADLHTGGIVLLQSKYLGLH